MIVAFGLELRDQLVDVGIGVLAQEVERVLPYPQVVLPHAVHGLIETAPRHTPTLGAPTDMPAHRPGPPEKGKVAAATAG
ncbi:hypothetical protein Acsp03_37440 [Actinomadura sp. NBRC 104412]|nr:hypothetical protein Acsp03_37440 [Actinomadura sp. NBRC 104412]